MARIIEEQVNNWASQGGPEPQRADLWVVDFTEALKGLYGVILDGTALTASAGLPYIPLKLATYFCRSISLPELKTRSEAVRRDSRPYHMPSWDEPLESIRMQFMLDCYKPGSTSGAPYKSDIYQMLDAWRAVVRAGRAGMSGEYAITLDGTYRIDYAYNVPISLLRPSDPTVTPATQDGMYSSIITNDLEFSVQYVLVNCWLSAFKLSELSYEGTKLALLDATFYADDIEQPPANPTLA